MDRAASVMASALLLVIISIPHPALAMGPEECDSFITGQLVNASGSPVPDPEIDIRNQCGDHTNHGEPLTNESGHFNLTGLCYGKQYSIMFRDNFDYDNLRVNWSSFQALGQDVGIVNISELYAHLYGHIWINETAQTNATSGVVEIYNLEHEFVWIKGACDNPQQCPEGEYSQALPGGEYYIRGLNEDRKNWGNANVSQGLVYVNLTAGSANETNLTANISGTIIEMGSMALDGTEKPGLWFNLTNKDDGTVIRKRAVNQTWGDIMVQFFMPGDSLFNVSVYDPGGTYGTRDVKEDYNTTSVGRLYFSLWNSSLAPTSDASINGIVIDSNGQALDNAMVKAIIYRLYDPDSWDADDEGWVHREWRQAVVNYTLTDSSGKFSLALPSPANDTVRYAIISYWDNSTTDGADYVKNYDRNGWRGYDFSGGRQINDSITELEPGATLKLNLYQPGGQARINSSWIMGTYNMGDCIWRAFSMQSERKPWGYEWEDYESDETQGGNFEDKSIFTINAPLGRNVIIAGMEVGTEHMRQHSAASAPMCVMNYTVQASQQGRIISMDCNMSNYTRTDIDVGDMGGEFMVMSPDDGEFLYAVHPRGEGSMTVPLRDDSLYNLTFRPWGPQIYSELYNVNVTETPNLTLNLGENKYFMDIELHESMSPGVEYAMRAFPKGDEGVVADLNMSYDIYYGNESFFKTGGAFGYQNVSLGPKSKEFYNSTINIAEPGSYFIAVKAGVCNGSDGIYTYTMEQRDIEVWNLMVDVWSDKWTFMRGDKALLFLRAFNISTKQPVYNANYTVTIYDFERRKEYSIISSTLLTNNDETKINFTIPEYLQEGWYRITVTVSNESENFKGKRNLHFHLTNMNFGVRFEKFEVAPDEDQNVYIVARDRDGQPVASMNVTIEDIETGYTASGDTDQGGMLTLAIPSSSYGGIYGWHEVEISAFSPDGKKEKTFEGFVVIPVKMFIESNGRTRFAPGENLTWEIGIVSMQDGLTVPPPEECFMDPENFDMDDTCDDPMSPFYSIKYSSIATTLNKGDLIPGPPMDIRIYYPNGSLYLEDHFEGDFGQTNKDNPLYDLTEIPAGSVPGAYRMEATLNDEITTQMSYKVRTVELKAYTDKAHYIMYDLAYGVYGQDNVTAFVEAINYSTGKPVPVSGAVVTARLFGPSGINITPEEQNTTDSQGRTTFNFSDSSIWDDGGVHRILLNLTDTGDTREIYFSTHWLFADLNVSDTELELGDSFIVNVTFLNGTPNYAGPIGWITLDEVTFTLIHPDGMQYQYRGKPQENGNRDFYWAEINISQGFPSGTYLLKVSGGQVEETYAWTGYNETRLEVGGYELDVFLNREGKPEYGLDDEAKVMARLTYSNGTPIQGAVLTYELFDERKHTYKGSMTAPATDSDGMTALTYGPEAEVELSKDGVYLVKVKYKPGSSMLAKGGITFIITGISVDLTTDHDEYTTGDDLLINLTASKQGSPVLNGTAMAMIIPPNRPPYPVWVFTETKLASSTVYSVNISGLLTESGMYFIMGGVDDVNGSFGGDAREIFVQDFNLSLATENMTYTEGDNVTFIINASNATGYLNGSLDIELFRKGAGQVNSTQSSIEGNTTVTFMDMTPGAYMAEVRMVADNGDKAISNEKFGVRSLVAYSLTTKDASNTRSYFKASEPVYIHIAPSIPSAGSSIIIISPDGSKATLPAGSSPVSLSASQKSQAGWYMLRLESGTGIVYATAMFQVKS
jgi:hypothetical protein